jgi:hypothetical protein
MKLSVVKLPIILMLFLLFVGTPSTSHCDIGPYEDEDGDYEWVYVVIFEADFDGDFPPEGWEIQQTANHTWRGIDTNNDWDIEPFGHCSAFVDGDAVTASSELLVSPWFSDQACHWTSQHEFYGHVWLDPDTDDLFDLTLDIAREMSPNDWEQRHFLNRGWEQAGWNSFKRIYRYDYGGEYRIGIRFQTEDKSSDEKSVGKPFAIALDNLEIGCWSEEWVPNTPQEGDDDDSHSDDEDDDDDDNDDNDSACSCGTSGSEPAPYLFVVMLLVGFLAMGLSLRTKR